MRVVIAEDSLLLREGIARVLESSGIDVVGLAGDLDSLLQAVDEHRPDVAITDIRMPPTHTDEGLQAAHRIREELPSTGVLVLSQYLDEDYVFKLLGNGAQSLGYLLKDRITDGDAFVDAVRRVAAGEAALDPEVVAHLLGRPRGGGPLDELNERERTVLAEMAEGRSNNAIASRLFLSDRAVERHVTAIFTKLHLTATPESHRRVQAVLAYLRA